jgi:hypothetical protein
VFAVLATSICFQFSAIDTDGKGYTSEAVSSKGGPDRTLKTSDSLRDIIRRINWMVTSMQSVSPGGALADTEIAEPLARLIKGFIQKNPFVDWRK